jgi:AGCS family alanine or glycine:cation symporter
VVLAVLAGLVVFGGVRRIAQVTQAVVPAMALVNLVAIGLLSGIAFRLLQDYTRRRRARNDPVFTRDLLPEIGGIQCWDDAQSVTGHTPVAPR